MRFSTVLLSKSVEHFRLVVVGGGAAGCAVASKFARILPRHKIAVVEPKLQHLYQPGLTLAAVGLMDQRSLVRSEHSVLPRGVHWLQSGVAKFQPALNQLRLADADSTKVSYDFLVIATGIELRFDLIDGLPRNRKSVLELPGICSIYFPEGAAKTQAMIGAFQTGQTALFTFPNWPIKCPGAPQKILYLAEERFREREVRRGSQVLYATALGRVFGVQKWSDALLPMVQRRGIKLETRLNLCRVDPAERVATFQVLDEENKPTGEHKQFQYDLLHIGAPCSPVAPLREHAKASVTGEEENDSKQLTDAAGFIRVDPNTLQSLAHGNVFAIGDCANTPNAKTAAAVSSQLKTLSRNLRSVMAHQSPTAFYDGYASCPLVVGRRQAMLAEFNPQGPMETFPFWQTKPNLFVYWLKRYVMPPLYWRFLLRGRWQGPAMIRRFFHPFRTIRTYWSGGREALEKGVGCGQS